MSDIALLDSEVPSLPHGYESAWSSFKTNTLPDQFFKSMEDYCKTRYVPVKLYMSRFDLTWRGGTGVSRRGGKFEFECKLFIPQSPAQPGELHVELRQLDGDKAGFIAFADGLRIMFECNLQLSSDADSLPVNSLKLPPCPPDFKLARTSFVIQGPPEQFLEQVKRYCEARSVRHEVSELHPAWLSGTGFGSLGDFQFECTLFVAPSPAAPGDLLVELWRLEGSCFDFAAFAQGLADELNVVFKCGSLRCLPRDADAASVEAVADSPKLPPLPSYLTVAGTSFVIQGPLKQFLEQLKRYCEARSVQHEVSDVHPAWLSGTGFGGLGEFNFEVALFAAPSPATPGDLLVELRRLTGSRSDFAAFAQGLADELRVVFKCGPVGPLGCLPLPSDAGAAPSEAAAAARHTALYLNELLKTPERAQQVQALQMVASLAALGNPQSIIFKIGNIAANVTIRVARLAVKGHPSGMSINTVDHEFHALALAAHAALAALECCDPAELEIVASAAVLGVNKGTYHARREALRCIVALAKRPEALQKLRVTDEFNPEAWLKTVTDDNNDLEAIALANQVITLIRS